MSDYRQYDINRKKHDLLLNRIAIINQTHGCRYDYLAGNPCEVRNTGRWYECYYGGDLLTSWDVLDVSTLDSAFAALDALADAVWLVRRAGFLRMLIS